MGSRKVPIAVPLRWIVAFALLLLVCSAAPVLADATEPDPGSAIAEAPTGDDPERYFDGHVVPVDLGAVEREEREREEWLASPEAVKQRETSWQAFGDLSPEESEELLRSVFAEQLATLNGDPARFLSDAQLLRPQDETSAAVKDGNDRLLLDATIPLRVEDEQGELAKVDLSLTETPQGYETANAVSDLRLPLAGDEKAEVGDQGFAISQAAAEGSSARRFGDKNLRYPEVLSDTDLMIAPTGTGVELFDLLRSKESPEDLRFDLDLPPGAVLRATEYGGAEVLREGETLNRIAPPVATDAQGSDVPVELSVEESAIALHVNHRSGDFAYPILLDPIVEDWANTGNNWYEGKNLAALTNGAWKYKSNNSQIGHDVCCYEGHTGLLTYTQGNVFYGSEQYGQWSYSTPNYAAFITWGWITPFWRNVGSCGWSVQPHDYAGILWEPGEVWNPLRTNQAQNGQVSMSGKGQAFIIGLGSGPPGVWISCARYLYAGGVALWLDDDWGPAISVSGIPSGWASDLNPITPTIKANDNGMNVDDDGLGIDYITINPDGAPILKDDPGCSGLYGSTCPAVRTWQPTFTGDSIREGIRDLGVTAADPTGKTVEQHYTTMVDRTPPEVTLDGQLAEATDEDNEGSGTDPAGWDKLRLPVYNLKVEATDGATTSNLTKRSGVKNIEVLLDGKKMEVPWSPLASCPGSSCAMTKTYQLKMNGLAAGKHMLEVNAIDFVGKVRERDIEFEYIPATGMKDEYVMQYFPLPDGQGDESEEEHPARPELAVNLMNGNLVYRERDIDVEGPAVDLEVERFYNSMLPPSQSTEWGDGWTLAQTPDLEPIKSEGSPVADSASLLSSSGALDSGIALPTTAGAQTFDPALQATLTKTSNGGYELTDETGQSATSVSFASSGRTEARLTDGPAKVDYGYEGGVLSEIEVSDPATFSADPEELEELGSGLIEAPTYSSSFGALGSGDGQLKSPGDVAVDSAGNLWVVDTGNNRVEKFDPAGKFLAKFGSFGSGNGQFNRPTSIAIASNGNSNGNLLITDAGNGRVERFSSAGTYLSQFGSKGTGTGQFASAGPEGIAIDASGNIWVSDTYGGRLQKFSSAGAFIKVISSKGSGTGQLGEPTGIDVDPGGNVWVADWQNNRVSVFNSGGEFLSQFGSAGTGNGQFSHPDAIEVDNLGNVWVGDQSNNRVQQFDLAAQFVAKFGTAGSGAGQFNFAYPMGIAADSKGHLWVSDVNNNRIQQWLVPLEKPVYLSAFGTNGSGDGQLKTPSGVAVGFGGALWVADKGNNRIEKFDSAGKFLAKFGSLGTGNGQFNRPAAITIDRDGNLLVADANNNRIEKFNSQGEFVSKFGTGGSGNGQFAGPEGITTDFKGNIWVADTYNGRLQKFNEDGEFIKAISSKGSGTGQLGEPTGIDVDAGGNVWVTDWQNNRVSVFSNNGEFLSQFGSAGTGNGQFSHPDAINIDAHNNVWVGDQSNGRVQRFNLAGQYVGQFGAKGSGQGQFNFAYPMGIASDSQGHLWVSDVNNNRIQQWQLGNYAPVGTKELDLNDGDPSVDVQSSGGLIGVLTSAQAGENVYQHAGTRLTAHTGPVGETKYSYDTAGRMTKVTLPNGTWGEITYNQTYGRVSSVTVDPAGPDPAKKTEFEFSDEPRRTVVIPPDAPHVTYDIGPDGSVLKWWNALQPPQFDDISGTIYDNRGKLLWAGDHNLTIQAHSEEGIASIDVIVNGSELVDERICTQTEAPGIECTTEINEWVTSTDLHAPGRLDLEVIITDRLNHSASERFWVDIPPPPPPPALGTPIPPKFRDIASFREEFGLDVVDPVANEIELNERIFNLIKAWYEPGTPAGQVARATMERWGVPLRPKDVAELEYREWFYDVNGERIDRWVEESNPATFAGYYIDHKAGGIMHVGFTENQAAQLESLKVFLPLVAEERLQDYPTAPATPYLSLEATSDSIGSAIESNATLRSLVTSLTVGESDNQIHVGALDVAQVKSILNGMFGSTSSIVVEYLPRGERLTGRFRNSGRMRAGDSILNANINRCTAGFGAYDKFKVAGKDVLTNFVLTAGHCYGLDELVLRSPHSGSSGSEDWRRVGFVKRRAYGRPEPMNTDAEAIRIDGEGIVPRGIFGWSGNLIPTGPVSRARVGNRVCFSGAHTQVPSCGNIVAREKDFEVDGVRTGGYLVEFETPADHGDSGAPVWNPRTGASIGLVTGGNERGQTLVEPLLHPPRMNEYLIPGIMHNKWLQPLQLKLGG